MSRAMPSAVMAEKAVVSCMIQNPKGFVGRAAAEGLDESAFWHLGPLRSAVIDFYKADPEMEGEIDITALVQGMALDGTLDRSGGPAAVYEAYTYAINPAGWPKWSQQLREAKARRIAITGAVTLDGANDSEEAIETAKGTLAALTAAVSGKLRAVTAKEAANAFINSYQNDYAAGDIPGTSTGIAELDAHSGGMRAGEFWVVGGKPSRGKSVFMLQIASEFISQSKTVAVFSLEMMANEIIGRLISAMVRVDYGTITQPRSATTGDMAKIKRGVENLIASNLWVDCSPGQTLDTIETEAERIRDVNGSISLVVVDYLQLIRGSRGRGESREEEIAKVSGGLKQLAKRLQCPVISATQLNDSGQTRESRAIEQDADALLMIVEDGIKICKLRNGQRDSTLSLVLDGQYQRFNYR